MAIDANLADAFRFHRAEQRRRTLSDKFTQHAWQALERARADVAAGKRRYPCGDYGPGTWQNTWEDRPGASHLRKLYALHDETGQGALRKVGEVVPDDWRNSSPFNTRGDKSGWYTDPEGEHSSRDGTGLCWGVVYQLPARGGKARFVPGYQFGGTDGGPTLDLGDIYDETDANYWNTDPRGDSAARDAARRADRMAQLAAEREQAYQAAWQAGREHEELGDRIREDRQEARAIVREVKAARAARVDGFPTLCRAIDGRIRELKASRRAAYARRQELASEFASQPGWDG